jgi:purine nucleosidase
LPRKILIDCDPGHDDAMAIMLAAGNPEIELMAITTVAGNQTLPKTTLNARRVCSVAGIDVPIAAGCDRPLLRELVIAPMTHGDSGLDGPNFGEPTVPLDERHAVDLIIATALADPGEVTLVPIGPLTNIATAIRREARLVENVREVVLMGGAYTRGNSTPAAEFNVFVDPEAAAIVFEAGWPLTMVGLDLTHQALATIEVVERIRALDTPLAEVVVDLLGFFTSTYRSVSGFVAPPVHDACAVARLIDPGIVHCEDAFIAIETAGRWTSGMTVTDFMDHPRLGRRANAKAATKLDFDGFWDLMLDALERLGGRVAVS